MFKAIPYSSSPQKKVQNQERKKKTQIPSGPTYAVQDY